ncbi:helix-turn-helix domain-containing protein [Chitinasiproducens palmae]|uniref:HTH cro/C1-type domain-containing protein n=1 Tax=Chitinasiproducens palmae TaxID=1770053 RepID=A0A1H2PL29_9BURK|nr:hypothetical protein [Chitinasiproducens palmae]SDV46730.1 hypothetical protein SAMN05216551_101586 [Chitinasiproducens palmae]
MRTLKEISEILLRRFNRMVVGKLELAHDAGVTYRTLNHVLGGEQDYKVSTLLAIADRLGLELTLVPREAAAGMPSEPQNEVRTRVQAALDQLGDET